MRNRGIGVKQRRRSSGRVALSAKDPRSYLREYTTGNVPLLDFTRVMARAVAMESATKAAVCCRNPPYRALVLHRRERKRSVWNRASGCG